MKTLISAVAVALSLGATVAHADVQASFPDGYTIVTEASYAPVSAEVIASLPQPSFVDYVVVEAGAGEASRPATTLTSADLPQPSFIAG